MKKLLIMTALATLTILPPAIAGEGHGHEKEAVSLSNIEIDNHDDHGEEESAEVDLNADSIKMAGIVVTPLTLKNLRSEVKAPGEVTVNTYLSSKITPRIEAQIVARHAKMGDAVVKNQVLVTLSSVDMAEAVGELLVAHKEWIRLKQLGSSAVSAKRYNMAKIANDQALSKVLAYGMTQEQITELYKGNKKSSSGEFQLLASKDGVIVSDDFIEGDVVEAGYLLFDIINEKSLWVESKLSPEQALNIEIGSVARIDIGNSKWLKGKVVQKHHVLDKETRTIGVRIEIDNKDDKLHSGMYVDTKIETLDSENSLAVPTKAVLRSSDGDWVVFIEEKAGQFKPVEIDIAKIIGDYTVITNLPIGTKIVTEGAFFVQSELAKSGFAVHNH